MRFFPVAVNEVLVVGEGFDFVWVDFVASSEVVEVVIGHFAGLIANITEGVDVFRADTVLWAIVNSF